MFLYTVALGYPNTPTSGERAAAKNLLLSLQDLLPCDKCRINFRNKIGGELGGARLEDALQCSETLTRYIYDLETSVSATTGKAMPSFADTRARLMSNTYVAPAVAASVLGASDTPTNNGLVLGITLPLVAIALVALTWGVTRVALTRKNKL